MIVYLAIQIVYFKDFRNIRILTLFTFKFIDDNSETSAYCNRIVKKSKEKWAQISIGRKCYCHGTIKNCHGIFLLFAFAASIGEKRFAISDWQHFLR